MRPGRKTRVAAIAAAAAALAWLALPRPPLREGIGFSRAVFDRDGHLLRLTLAPDDRYRLWVPLARISPAVVEATLLHEDRWFRAHPGVNPVSLLRGAARTYLGGGRRMGGSTLTMQLARIRYRIDSRTPWGKLVQILRALQLERHYSKEELLEAYLNLAPYGNNVEGVGTAALVYFDEEAERLGVREAIALAVVPQSPARRAFSRSGECSAPARFATGACAPPNPLLARGQPHPAGPPLANAGSRPLAQVRGHPGAAAARPTSGRRPAPDRARLLQHPGRGAAPPPRVAAPGGTRVP